MNIDSTNLIKQRTTASKDDSKFITLHSFSDQYNDQPVKRDVKFKSKGLKRRKKVVQQDDDESYHESEALTVTDLRKDQDAY